MFALQCFYSFFGLVKHSSQLYKVFATHFNSVCYRQNRPQGAQQLWRRASYRRARVRFQIPLSACRVRARKIRDSESPMVGRQQFTMGVVSEKNFPPFQRYIKIEEVDDGCCCHLSYNEAEIGLLLLKNSPHTSEVTYPPCLTPCTGRGLPSGTRQQQQ